jgi:hypothetical protein
MSFVHAPARLSLLSVVGGGRRQGPVPHGLLAVLLTAMMLYGTTTLKVLRKLQPLAGSLVHSTLTPLIVVVALAWWNGIVEIERRRGGSRIWVCAVLAYIAAMIVVGRLVSDDIGNTAGTTFLRTTTLFPLAAAAGFVLLRAGRLAQYCSWLLAVGAVTVVAALYERFRSVSLLNSHHSLYVESGRTRAIVGAEHPLVLAAMFLVLIPIAMWLGGRWRFALALWLLAGIYCTGSNGPLIVGAVVTALCVLPPLSRFVFSSWRPLICLLIVIALGIGIGAGFFWDANIHGASASDSSNEYRGSLYYLMLKMIQHQPFGYGFGGLPTDAYRVEATRGIIEVAKSIDSDLVLAVSQFGIFALVGFAAIAAVAVFAAVRHNAVGLSALSVSLVGLFMAVRSWTSLGTCWFFLFGACLGVFGAGGTHTWWTGLASRDHDADHFANVGLFDDDAVIGADRVLSPHRVGAF